MTVKNLIKSILGSTNIHSEKDLKNLNKSELEEINNDVNVEVSSEGLIYGEDALIGGDAEEVEEEVDAEVEEEVEEEVDAEVEEEVEEEVVEPKKVVVNLSKLSKVERRTYARTGQLPANINDRV